MRLRSLVAVVVSSVGLSLLVTLEGTKLTAYQDGAGIWTICTGHIKGVFKGMTATKDQCDQFLRDDLADSQATVRKYVTTDITQSQFDALALFVFNIGEPNFKTSTLLRKLNAGDKLGAALEFQRWNQIRNPKTGKLEYSRGLANRRLAEQNLFMKDMSIDQ